MNDLDRVLQSKIDLEIKLATYKSNVRILNITYLLNALLNILVLYVYDVLTLWILLPSLLLMVISIYYIISFREFYGA